MPRGYPDYFGQSIFPKYGELIRINTTKIMAGSEVWTVFDIDSKGVLYFLHIESKNVAGYDNLDIELTIDGSVFYNESVTDMYLYQNLFMCSHPLAMVYNNEASHYLAIGLTKEVPFGTQIKLIIENGGADTPLVEVRGGYTEIR